MHSVYLFCLNSIFTFVMGIGQMLLNQIMSYIRLLPKRNVPLPSFLAEIILLFK